MSTHANPQHLQGLELLAAVNALRPDAAPLAGALVRAGCVPVPDQAAMLAALDGLGHADTIAGSPPAQVAMVAAWRGAQGLAPGVAPNPAAWRVLDLLGLGQQATAAMQFAISVMVANMDRAASDDAGPLLH